MPPPWATSSRTSRWSLSTVRDRGRKRLRSSRRRWSKCQSPRDVAGAHKPTRERMSREAYRLRTVAPARGSQELTSRWTARLKSARQFPASSDVTSRPAHSRRSHPQRGLTSMPPHPANKGPGHHPAQHTRSQAVLGPHGARRKTPGEMGWVLLGGTITSPDGTAPLVGNCGAPCGGCMRAARPQAPPRGRAAAGPSRTR